MNLVNEHSDVDFDKLAKELDLGAEAIRQTVGMLDDGNTVPFITRYRKDLTGGLNEQQILDIQEKVEKLRLLEQRRESILRSIKSQAKLTDELARRIEAAQSIKRLEDLYLPFKPKKQTLATIARERGLEPLANELLSANPAAADRDRRAEDFLDADNGLNSSADVLQGVGHLLAEQFSENVDLKDHLRDIYRRSGRITTRLIATEEQPLDHRVEANEQQHSLAPLPSSDTSESNGSGPDVVPTQAAPVAMQTVTVSETRTGERLSTSGSESVSDVSSASSEGERNSGLARKIGKARLRQIGRHEARQRKRRQLQYAFRDYSDYHEPLLRVPPHRVLAINRGERFRALRVKIEVDAEALSREAERRLVPEGHPHADFLTACVRDALFRLVLPSLEREARRELTQRAEEHAVSVFTKNLRKLLLQPPIHGHRVLAVDPGFRHGCKLAALDEFGNVLENATIHVIGKEEQRQAGRARMVELIRRHGVTVVAIGNGSGCREAEKTVAELIATELQDHQFAYVVVNEAGASVYSTSSIGREELPQYDATMRGAISIGRRLLDPLSELVKINPCNIGVGLYQHDVKSKPLQASLDAVVQSCVNFVGVDVNTASPALLRYVSGLNQLTARRLYEFRCQNGPFASRQQLREVPGIGEATFVQAAGFLKVTGGENPLDATSIHPESYADAQRVLAYIDSNLDELAERVPRNEGDPGHLNAARMQVTSGPEECGQTAVAAAAATQGERLVPVVDTGPLPASTGEKQPPATRGEDECVTTSVDGVNGSESLAATRVDPAVRPDSESDSHRSVKTPSLAARIKPLDTETVSRELGIGQLLLNDILASLARPGRDPREDLSKPVFRREVLKLEDLQPGMELSGTVLNVVDFGAFVDIGLTDSGLVHISRLADRYIADPHEVVSVGDILTVWVVGVDKERRRVSLTAVKPGTERPQKASSSRSQRDAADKPHPPARPSGGGRGRQPSGPHQSRRNKQRKNDKSRQTRTTRSPRKEKPVVPITKAMAEGREPMRTFSDLKQFYERKSDKTEGRNEPEGEPDS